MKNIVLSAVAVLAMSSFAVAGGNIAPIEEPVVVEEVVVVENLDAGFYLGLGYGALSAETTYTAKVAGGEVSYEEDSRDFDQLILQAGYKFNAYVAVEGRYWLGMNDLSSGIWYNGALYDTDAALDAWGIYVKPMYPVTDAFDIYALLGYATTTLTEDVFIPGGTLTRDTDLDGFSWGIGAAYTFNDSISIWADYVVMYDDTYDEYGYAWEASRDFTIDIINVGVSYKF